MPRSSDRFGKKGLQWLRTLVLPVPDGLLLQQMLADFELLSAQIKVLEQAIAVDNQHDPAAARLQNPAGSRRHPRRGHRHRDRWGRAFLPRGKLCAYAGLEPTTHASGGKIYHGPLLPFFNEWLRRAFIEASWSAISCAPALGALFRQHRARGKPEPKAITVVARRFCRIV